MRQLFCAVGIGVGLLFLGGQADAQWQYTDAKGDTQVTQWKLGVPAALRDAAVWIGPIGQPAVSPNPVTTRDQDLDRRIRDADATLAPYLKADAEAEVAREAQERRDIADAAQAKEDRAEARQDRWIGVAEESVRVRRDLVDHLRYRSYWRRR